jgi:CubicO group peptidase (beta-lactamase class C family)
MPLARNRRRCGGAGRIARRCRFARVETAMRKFFLMLAFLAFVACGDKRPEPSRAASQASALVDPARVDEVLKGFVDRDELVGVSALVFENGREAYFGAHGMADREAGRPMQRDTLVRIYSMTKPLTGVTLLTFYEDGLFALDVRGVLCPLSFVLCCKLQKLLLVSGVWFRF